MIDIDHHPVLSRTQRANWIYALASDLEIIPNGEYLSSTYLDLTRDMFDALMEVYEVRAQR